MAMYSGAEAFSEPRTTPIFNWANYAPYFQPAATAYRNFSRKGGEADQLYNQYKTDYLGNSQNAADNAQIYQDYARGLFSTGGSQNNFADYKQVGDYQMGLFNQFRDSSANAGLASMNSRLAGLGIRPGSTGYDRLLNATRITNNLAPVFANTTNAIGRDYGTLANNNYRDIALRLGMAQDDTLTGYTDRVAERPMDVAATRLGLINAENNTFGNLVGAFNKNVAGYKTEETNDIAKFGRVFDNWMNAVYSGYGGGGGGANAVPQQPQMNQLGGNGYTMPYSGYPMTGNTGGAMSPAQNSAWMNQYNGGATDPNLSSVTGGYGGAF